MNAGLATVLRRFEAPDEIRVFPKGKFELIRIGGTMNRAGPSDNCDEIALGSDDEIRVRPGP